MTAPIYSGRPRWYFAAMAFWLACVFALLFCASWSYAQSAPSASNSDAGPSATQSKPPIDIPTMHRQPYFFTVLAASSVGWIVGMVKGFDGSKDWLGKYWPRSPIWFLFIMDAVIYVVVGGYAGTGLYQPATFQAAIAAGFSWPVALGALVSKK